MNSQTHPLFSILKAGSIGVFSMFAANPALAIEPPPDDAKPPAELENRIERPNDVAAKIPFIGVVTASLPEMVADHLNLKPGTGVIVRTVLPDSPADQCGLKVNDIILKINETAVNDPETFSAEIRNRKIGDALKLETIQKGKPSELKVTLAERPADAFAGIPNQAPLLLDGLPDEQAQRLRDLIERNLGAFGQDNLDPWGGNMRFPDPLGDEPFQMLRERMGQALKNVPEVLPQQLLDLDVQKQSTIHIMDNEGSVEIKSTGENSEVIVRDRNNKIVWSGPWDTEQDKAAAPDNIRARIDRVNIKQGGGIHLRLGR